MMQGTRGRRDGLLVDAALLICSKSTHVPVSVLCLCHHGAAGTYPAPPCGRVPLSLCLNALASAPEAGDRVARESGKG